MAWLFWTLAATVAVSACGAASVAVHDMAESEGDGELAEARSVSNAARPSRCAEFALGRPLGRVASPALTEISGIAASRARPGLLWVHNDSGRGPVIHAIERAGRLVASFRLDGAPAFDWEDVAIERRDGARDRLWIGDVGDNAAREGTSAPRPAVVVVRFDEPSIDLGPTPFEERVESWEVIVLRYPDRPHDAEAIAVEPGTGDLWVFAKESEGPSGAYRARAPIAPGEERVLDLVATIHPGSMTTGADFSPDGRELLLRTYRSVLLFERANDESWSEALTRMARTLPHAPEPQGEAIAFAHDGSGYYTISEGLGVPIWFYERRCRR